MAASSSPPLVMTAGPLLLGFFFNLFLYGVLVVQGANLQTVYLYYIGFPKDRWWFKALVYGVFILEVTQTVIQCHDKFDLYAKEFGVIVSLEKLRFSWHVVHLVFHRNSQYVCYLYEQMPILIGSLLASLTGGIVQPFQAWRIYTFSKTWFISIGIWIQRVVGISRMVSPISTHPMAHLFAAGIAQGIISVHLTVPQIVTNTKTTGIIWFTTTAINDVCIAGILTYYLNRLKSGDKKTQKLLSKFIRLTVETGSITALSAVIILITAIVIPPWFFTISDCIVMETFSSLPIDIARLIVELVAESQDTAGTLSSVLPCQLHYFVLPPAYRWGFFLYNGYNALVTDDRSEPQAFSTSNPYRTGVGALRETFLISTTTKSLDTIGIMETDPSLPVDIARIIVEIAADSHSVACSLSLVSHQVHFWADPTLFRNIKISSNNVGIKMKAFISRFISPNPTARLLRAREYIQIFSTKQIDDEAEEIPRFLACCTRLFSVCIWSVEMRPSFFDLSIPTLKRLSFSRFVSTMDLSFQLPIFRSVTHLDLTPIPFDRWNELWDANLSFIPNLTHLALDFSEDPAYFNEIISTISSNITFGIQLWVTRETHMTKCGPPFQRK
ncbi:hypothetical protein DL96DRAFT_1810711 [Flagelloscypha sp. PMI_526]|nr:hypothetical protein DL96DRAFT_1810711 [Flagelloscypha sp. PMI_526]